jgi:predicted  nucleic acid-binding Zn-ribbon protein
VLFTDSLVLCKQMVENDKIRNATREALTALRKRAKTTKSSIPSPFEAIMREIEGSSCKPLVKEVCRTCGSHDPKENTWMMFSGSDIFVRMPFHAAHTILDKGAFLFH